MSENTIELVERLNYLEKSKLKKSLISILIPVIAALIFLFATVFGVIKLNSKNVGLKKANQILQKENYQLMSFNDSIRKDSTTRFSTFLIVNVSGGDSIITKHDLVNVNDASYISSKEAYAAIINLKKGSLKLNNLTLRYYPTRNEKYPLLKSLALSGFSWLFVKDDDYDSKIMPNAIHFSSSISPYAIKLAALSMIRVGLEVKVIAPYRPNYSAKDNSIEIGGEKSAIQLPALSIDSILRYKKPISRIHM